MAQAQRHLNTDTVAPYIACSETAGFDIAECGTAGSDTAGSDTAAFDTAGFETAASDTAARDIAATDTVASRELAARGWAKSKPRLRQPLHLRTKAKSDASPKHDGDCGMRPS